MEDQQGNTHLFYRIYSSYSNDPFYDTNNDIYHLDMETNSDSLFLVDRSHEDPAWSWFISVNDYAFWNDDFTKYIFCGSMGSWEPGPFIQRFDGSVINLNYLCCSVDQIDISTNNDSLIYSGGWLDNGSSLRSTDGGFNWDTFNETLKFISLNPFNDNFLFAFDDNGDLLKSTDGGYSFYFVDTLGNYNWDNFLYDINENYIYRTTFEYPFHSLIISDNQGEPFSWQTKYSSDSKISISNDESVSGTIYLADKKNIFVSTDYGNSFSLYKTLDRKIVGIYKKTNSNKLYTASKYKIYEITPDTIQIIKSLPIPEDAFAWLPLNLNDMWFSYHETNYLNGDTSKYLLRSEVVGYKLFDGKVYIKELQTTLPVGGTLSIENSFNYFRIDSANGFVYRAHFQNDSTLWFETFLMDLLAEVGDTIPSSFGAVLESEEPVALFGVSSTKRIFRSVPPWGQQFELVKGFGLIYDTVWTSVNYVGKLLGCVIDGVMYGDTTCFELYQNYPNPFNPSTKIKFEIPDQGRTVRNLITLKVYDVLGDEITTLVNEELPAGEYEVEFDATGLPSGIYFYQLKVGSFIQTKKMVLLK
jgi:hypothetical protein